MEEEKIVEVSKEDVKVEEVADANTEKAQEVVTESDIKGINISEDVVATIAGMAAQEVKGVASMNASGIGEVFGIKTKGVKVQVDDKDAVIEISLNVEYGARIPDIAWEVQNKVKTQVETMTGLNVVSVNVHVQGVNTPKKKNAEVQAAPVKPEIEEKQEEKKENEQ